jgi:hypothetical protein
MIGQIPDESKFCVSYGQLKVRNRRLWSFKLLALKRKKIAA